MKHLIIVSFAIFFASCSMLQPQVKPVQVKTIAEDKMPDLNCFTVESAMKMVAGTARSMGLNVKGKAPWSN